MLSWLLWEFGPKLWVSLMRVVVVLRAGRRAWFWHKGFTCTAHTPLQNIALLCNILHHTVCSVQYTTQCTAEYCPAVCLIYCSAVQCTAHSALHAVSPQCRISHYTVLWTLVIICSGHSCSARKLLLQSGGIEKTSLLLFALSWELAHHLLHTYSNLHLPANHPDPDPCTNCNL